MPLKPFDLQDKPEFEAVEAHIIDTEVPDEINNILANAGVVPPSQGAKDKSVVRDIFNKAGASVDAVAHQVSRIMSNGETDQGRLKACELALRVQGILQDLDEKPVPSITININGSENKTLINLVMP